MSKTRRFTEDEIAILRHALVHLEANHIADDNYPGYGGWYQGKNREAFIQQHRKALALLRRWVVEETP